MRRLWIPGIATTMVLVVSAVPASAQELDVNKGKAAKTASTAAAKAGTVNKAVTTDRNAGLKSVVPAAARSLPAERGDKAGCHGMKESDA